MKIFKCTVESSNGCSSKTLLVIANDKEDAHNQIVESKKTKYNQTPTIKYLSSLEELKLNLSEKAIIEVGFGYTDDDNDSED